MSTRQRLTTFTVSSSGRSDNVINQPRHGTREERQVSHACVVQTMSATAGEWISHDGTIRLIHADCMDVFSSILAGSIAAVITDPPYGIKKGAAFVRDGGATVANGVEAMNTTDDAYGWILPASSLVCAGGHIVSFYDRSDYIGIAKAIGESGFERWNEYVIVKQAPPPTPRPTFASAFEMAVIASRTGEKRNWYGGGYTPNRWIGMPGTVGCDSVGHTAQKPLDPIRSLVRALSEKGSTVIDPFIGSGTTAVACYREGRRCIGIERDIGSFDMAVSRLEMETAQVLLGL